jgi:dihydroneopterin aldolase
MHTETKHAFAHPEERAKALAADAHPADRISLRDHVVEVEIGAFQQERDTTQRLAFNVVVEVAAPDAPLEDDVDRILSYDAITEAIAAALAAERLNLLETLAERVAERILVAPLAQRVFVRIEKLDRGPGALGVEIMRGGAVQTNVVSDAPQPLVVFLAPGLIASPNLSDFITRCIDDPRPVVFCTGLPEHALPRTGDTNAQARIELLAIEQSAWQLAATDPRCTVVATRTELDWAMKNDAICVWAPSKLVLDAVEGPTSNVPQALASWLSKELQAAEFIALGTAGELEHAP